MEYALRSQTKVKNRSIKYYNSFARGKKLYKKNLNLLLIARAYFFNDELLNIIESMKCT